LLKRIITSFISLIALGATVAVAEQPSAEGTPSSTVNIRNVREATPPVPPTALQGQWWGLARQVGWAEKDLPILDFVINRESRGDNTAWNKQDPFGGSRCILQINGSWTKWLRAQDILQRPADLFNPTVCLTAGLAIHQYGMDRYGWGWGPWAIPAP
jgi:hypothetical protein